MNDIKTYMKKVQRLDKGFNMIEEYNQSPFNDQTIKIRRSTLLYTIKEGILESVKAGRYTFNTLIDKTKSNTVAELLRNQNFTVTISPHRTVEYDLEGYMEEVTSLDNVELLVEW